jgi:YfiH family protein
MYDIAELDTPRGRLMVSATERSHGSFHPLAVDRDVLGRRQAALTARPWTMVNQVHGTEVVRDRGDPWAPTIGVGDVVIASCPSRPIAVWTADCAPLVLVDERGGAVAGVHVGWRGLAAGIVDVAVDAMRAAGTPASIAVLGPTIGACCYEFEPADAAAVARGAGLQVGQIVATTAGGRPGLDMVAGVAMALQRQGLALSATAPCTGCDDRWFSHRVRHEAGRHATVVRLLDPTPNER